MKESWVGWCIGMARDGESRYRKEREMAGMARRDGRDWEWEARDRLEGELVWLGGWAFTKKKHKNKTKEKEVRVDRMRKEEVTGCLPWKEEEARK